MSGVTGDFRGLRNLIQNVEGVIAGGLQARAAQELAAESRKLIADEFRSERDPYGVPWEPLKHRDGKILRDTGYMAGHVGAEQTQGGFKVTINASYASVHQNGGTVKPHERKGGAIPVNKRGRFMSRSAAGRVKGKSQAVRVFGAHMTKGYKIPRRAMLPSPSWGGLGPIWTKAFNRVTGRVVRESLGRRVGTGG